MNNFMSHQHTLLLQLKYDDHIILYAEFGTWYDEDIFSLKHVVDKFTHQKRVYHLHQVVGLLRKLQ